MSLATLLSPSDNKSILGWFKSILGTCTAASDNASRSGQQIRADLATSNHRSPQAAPATSWPPQQLHSLKTQQNQGKISGFLREKQRLLMTLCPPIEKSIIQLFHYCIYPVILYKTTVILKKMAFFSCVREDPPLPEKFRPLFFLEPKL
jgi:hypothetical protein